MNARQILEQMEWLPPDASLNWFTKSGVTYGFSGVADGPPRSFHHAKQVHGTTITKASEPMTGPAAISRTEADGLFTQTIGTTIAVKTADCLPVLVASRTRSIVYALHAGWRGLTGGILKHAVEHYTGLGGAASDLIVGMGPAIGMARFEVGPEVIEALASTSLGLDKQQQLLAMAKGRSDRWHVDLAVAGSLSLVNAGVHPAAIAIVRSCTYDDSDRWYSYRRSGGGEGRNWSWISL